MKYPWGFHLPAGKYPRARIISAIPQIAAWGEVGLVDADFPEVTLILGKSPSHSPTLPQTTT